MRGNEEGQTKVSEQGISPWRVGNMTAVNCLSIVQSERHHPSPHLRFLLNSSGRGGGECAAVHGATQAHEVAIAGPPGRKGPGGKKETRKK